MFSRTFLIVLAIDFGVLALPNGELRSVLETVSTIEADGYITEVHHVTTTDGYILEMHRIPFRRFTKSGDTNRPVVFIMHGLLGASRNFIALGPRHAIAYNLADAGFDVWLGNARGNQNSRSHVTLDPDNSEEKVKFFDFTWEQIGMIDVANMIDYVLEKTGREKLHYLGHSQGGTAFLVLTSMRPEYNEKMASVHLLAGVGYMEYFPHFYFRNLAQFTEPIWDLALSLGRVELYPPGLIPFSESVNNINDTSFNIHQYYEAADYCIGEPSLKGFCALIGMREILPQTVALNSNLGNLGVGGAGLKQIAHYGQNIQDKVFRRWNYGPEGNLEAYGTNDSPAYNISRITANVTMHYTVSDNLLDERDVLAMAKDMPNTVARKVARESFSHMGFINAPDVRELVTVYIIQSIRSVENLILAAPELGLPSSAGNLVLNVFVKICFLIFSLNYFLI